MKLDKSLKLKTVAAFWKNDKPEGIGVRVDDPISLNHFEKCLDDYRKVFDSQPDREKCIRVMFEQLEVIFSDKTDLNLALNRGLLFVTVANIWLLEELGALESNEFNGCIFSYYDGPDDTSVSGLN